ncbi:MAG: nucleotidyltransferase domain-containing protein [Synechococcaceae bacterium WB8_1A_041]|nr:nucleotidyltransferase domain-containing protein [Synechococcaceae bacterium WB8_1A_041]
MTNPNPVSELPLHSRINGIPEPHQEKLRLVFSSQPNLEAVWLFGSRAMGSYKPGSDIDLCLEGENLNHNNRLLILSAVDDLLLPWQIDLVIMHQLDHNLLSHINRVGHCIWRKSTPKNIPLQHHQ